MDTKLTGIFSEGDTKDLKAWIEKLAGASDEKTGELLEIHADVQALRMAVDSMQKKLDRIESILEKVE
jgi:hypothetical protein